MKKFHFYTMFFFVIFSCQTKRGTSLTKGCYVYNVDDNLIKFEVEKTGETVSGNLDYAFAEKDKNHGTFTGHFKGDTLIGDYTFQSEGMISSREVAFLVKNNQLFEGYGQIITNGSEVKFKDSGALKFNSTMPLKQKDCN
ncbi:MAG: hypothetical protein V7767_09335 [Leeuwenhoekiella sp.]